MKINMTKDHLTYAAYLTPATVSDIEEYKELLNTVAKAVVEMAKSEERKEKIQRRERWVKHG